MRKTNAKLVIRRPKRELKDPQASLIRHQEVLLVHLQWVASILSIMVRLWLQVWHHKWITTIKCHKGPSTHTVSSIALS
jgi:hypothetical protein